MIVAFRLLASSEGIGAVGGRLCDAGHAAEGVDCEHSPGGKTKPGIRAVLPGLRRRLAGGERATSLLYTHLRVGLLAFAAVVWMRG